MDTKTLIILVLLVGVGVLGYLYYDSQQSSVRVDLPGVKIEAK
jgi:predicted negative regulator of RcsB-dependent stress response